MSETANRWDGFSAGWYFRSLGRLAIRPGEFFATLQGGGDPAIAFSFLLTSALFHTGCCLALGGAGGFQAVAALANALVMTAVIALITWLVLRTLFRRQTALRTIFAICAYSSGLFLLVSWLTMFLWFAESSKWIFIGIGLVRVEGLKRYQAFIVVILSVVATYALFSALVGMISAPAR